MNIKADAKFFIDETLDDYKIASKIASIITSFNNKFLIDYKIYEKLRKLSLETQNIIKLPEDAKVLKIYSKQINAIFYISIVDSNYLIIDKFINLNSGFCYENPNNNKVILIKIAE